MTMKWNVRIGDICDEVSADLLRELGYVDPHTTDSSRTARYQSGFASVTMSRELASAYATGLRCDAAALEAIRMLDKRRAANALLTARQKVLEARLKVEQERRAVESIALSRVRAAKGVG